MEEVVVLLPRSVADASVNSAHLEGKFIWDRTHVLELIKEYRKMENEFKDHTIKRKVLWRKIAQNLKKQGISVSWELCDKKWRNLKQTFKAIYTSKRSDTSMRRWEFYSELEDIFSNDPNIRGSLDAQAEHPDDSVDVVMSDIDSYLCNEAEVDEVDSNSGRSIYPKEQTNSKEGECVAEEEISRIKAQEVDAPIWFQEFLNGYREDEKARTSMMETILRDVVKLEERKCELLEQLCEKM